jgi:hypothetical protein
MRKPKVTLTEATEALYSVLTNPSKKLAVKLMGQLP